MGERIRVGVNGAGGRMGQRVIALANQDPQLEVVAALESLAHPKQGQDAGDLAGVGRIGVAIDSELRGRVDVVIDFSTPAGAAAIAAACAERVIPLVVATTGLHGATRDAVLTASQTTPVLISPSMSLAVNVTMKLARDAARVLKSVPEGCDVEVIERHHRFKEDAPSGTALKFGEIVANEMGQTEHVHGRHGRPGPRPRCEIGYHAIRTGDNVGEHTIVFGLMGETIDLTVRSHSRDAYAYGALAAAKFLAAQKPGLYSMTDVLGL
jgi:4-hydroxy-tetrahydrodipicolinate reductase